MITVRFLYYNWFGIIPDDYTEGNKNMIQAIVLLVFLIFLNSVFAGAEMAILSMNEAKMKELAEEGDHRAQILIKLTEQPAHFMTAIRVTVTTAGFLPECFCSGIFCTAYDCGTDKGRSRCTTEHSENRMYDHCDHTAFLCKSSVRRTGAKTSGNEKSG